MADYVIAVLDECDEALAKVESLYARDVAALALSGELLLAIRTVVQDCQSALDSTATRIRDKYLKKVKKTPYFPLAADPVEFATRMDQQLKGLAAKDQTVADAFERNQPYNPDRESLGYLHVLNRVNKHSDFSEQRRTTTPQIHIEGGKVIGEINGKPVVLSQDLDINLLGPANMRVTPVAQHTSARVLVGWNFVDPPVEVLPTLRNLTRQTRDAVEDIHHVATL